MAVRISHTVYPDNWSGKDFNQWVTEVHMNLRKTQSKLAADSNERLRQILKDRRGNAYKFFKPRRD